MADEQYLCLSLSFSISETKHVIKKLTTCVTVSLEGLIKNILLFPFKLAVTQF